MINGKKHYRNELGFHCYHVLLPRPSRWVFHAEPHSSHMEGTGASIKTRGDLPLGRMDWMKPNAARQWTSVPLVLEEVEVSKRRPAFSAPYCKPEFPPPAEEVDAYASFLGMEPERGQDSHLLWLAEESLCAPLPKNWTEHISPQTGATYFLDTTTKTASWHHPLEHHYALTYHKLRGCIAHARRLRAVGLEDTSQVDAVVQQYKAARKVHAGAIATIMAEETTEQKKARKLRWKFGSLAARAALTVDELSGRKEPILAAMRSTLGEASAEEALRELSALIRSDDAVHVDATVVAQLSMEAIRTTGALLKTVGSGLHLRRPSNHVHGHAFHASVVGPARKRLAAAARLQAAGDLRRAHQHANVALQLLRGGFAASHGLEHHDTILEKVAKEKQKPSSRGTQKQEKTESVKTPHLVQRGGKLQASGDKQAANSRTEREQEPEAEPDAESEPEPEPKDQTASEYRRERPALWESAHTSRTRARKAKKRWAKQNPDPSHDEVTAMLAQSHAVLHALKDTAPPAKEPKLKGHGTKNASPERNPGQRERVSESGSHGGERQLGQTQSLPEIVRHSEARQVNTPGLLAAKQTAEERQRRQIAKRARHRREKSIAQARHLYMSDQAAQFDRTLAVTSKEGLSMQWNAQTFAQVTAELSLEDENASADSAGDTIALLKDPTTMAAAMKEWPPPAEGSEGQLIDVNVAFGDESVVQAATASDAESTRQVLAERRKRTAAMDAVWGIESVAPHELTPRRRDWNADSRIYSNHKEMLEASKNPLRACVLQAGATLEAAPRAHSEDLRLPRHGAPLLPALHLYTVGPAHANTQATLLRYQNVNYMCLNIRDTLSGTNRFRAVTPNSTTPNGPLDRPAAVVARGHHAKEGQPDYSNTQNSFAVPKDWYVATVDTTPPVRLPPKTGAFVPSTAAVQTSFLSRFVSARCAGGYFDTQAALPFAVQIWTVWTMQTLISALRRYGRQRQQTIAR